MPRRRPPRGPLAMARSPIWALWARPGEESHFRLPTERLSHPRDVGRRRSPGGRQRRQPGPWIGRLRPLAHWQSAGLKGWENGDFNYDLGVVDKNDLVIMENNGYVDTPEPSTLALLALSAPPDGSATPGVAGRPRSCDFYSQWPSWPPPSRPGRRVQHGRRDTSLQFVTVGDPGNATDPSTGYGAVPYTYQMGKYDVTLGQYTAFLNAVATTSDPCGLYNVFRQNGAGQFPFGISQTWNAVSQGYSYSVTGSNPQAPNMPVSTVLIVFCVAGRTDCFSTILASSYRGNCDPANESTSIGFRVASSRSGPRSPVASPCCLRARWRWESGDYAERLDATSPQSAAPRLRTLPDVRGKISCRPHFSSVSVTSGRARI